jgi:SAM-dependent methyltransferase
MAEPSGYDQVRSWDRGYSQWGPVSDPGPQERAIVAALRDLAGDGPVLELAVGNGRIAIPLAATGLEVDGIDTSQRGIDELRAHPQGAAVNASVADLSDFALGRKYSLVYCVANSLFNVTTQEAQIRCFERVAAHLAPGGVFLVHSSYTPAWFEQLPNGQYVEARHFELNFAWLQALRVDAAEQLVYQQDLLLSKKGNNFLPCVHRYASVGELDLMARIAGLDKRERWGTWTREPYDARSLMLLATYTAR